MSCSCGVFILMYALHVILEGTFDFSESDIPSIRRWWSALLLEKFPPRSVMEIQQRKRRRTDKPHKTVATVDQALNIQELPPLVLREILLEVVLQDGDVAIGSLALTCRCCNSIVRKVSAERLTFGGWTVSFINVTVWLITALSLFFLSYVWLNIKTMMRSADNFFFFFFRVS
ncbi:uncharacterized protein LOC143742516 [Siphateles boraxobius]|uniref:uncharacterized protein LOC143742516 n=1 Tax=Siphateles boraxobius TaxID=180520 RepID=UPI004062DE72